MLQRNQIFFSCLSFYQIKRRLRMRTQIWIINFIILSLLALLVTLAQSLNIQYVQQVLEQEMFDFILNDMHNHLCTAGAIMNHQIESVFKQTQIALFNVNEIRLFQLENKIVINLPTTFPCDTMSLQYQFTTGCRNLKSRQNNEIIESFEELVHFVNPLMFEILGMENTFVPNSVYFAQSNTSFMFFYPYVVVSSSYDPTSRIWYINHMKNIQNNFSSHTQLTDVYKYFQNGLYAITMTQSMLTKNKIIEGIIASDIVLGTRFIESKSLDFMITDAKGDLILTNYRNYKINSSTEFHRFDDTKVTGFNSFDWQCLVRYANKQENETICSIDGKKVLRRYNSIYGQEVALQIQKIGRLNIYIILFYSISLETEVFHQLVNLSQEIIQDYCISLVNYTLSVAFLLLILQALIIQMIFNPIYSIIKSITNLISSKSRKKFEFAFTKNVKQLLSDMEREYEIRVKNRTRDNKNYQTSNYLKYLQQTFSNLYNRILENETVINPQCSIVQQFQYPKKSDINLYKLSDIIEIKNISNDLKESQYKQHFDVNIIFRMLY